MKPLAPVTQTGSLDWIDMVVNWILVSDQIHINQENPS